MSEPSVIQADTPVSQPPSRLEKVKAFVGDLARPFAIYVTSASAAWATVSVVYHGEGYEGAALFIGAVYTGLGALYWGKSFENKWTGGQAAEVEKVKVTTAPAPTVITSAPSAPPKAEETDPTLYGGPRL